MLRLKACLHTYLLHPFYKVYIERKCKSTPESLKPAGKNAVSNNEILCTMALDVNTQVLASAIIRLRFCPAGRDGKKRTKSRFLSEGVNKFITNHPLPKIHLNTTV